MSRLVSAEELLVLELECNTNLHSCNIVTSFSNSLHPLKLKAPHIVLSNANVFKFTLIPQWTYFLLVRKIGPFSNEKVVITQSDACRLFYAPIYAK